MPDPHSPHLRRFSSADCSLRVCPNGCSGHGECHSADGGDDAASLPSCSCHAGWSGADCASEQPIDGENNTVAATAAALAVAPGSAEVVDGRHGMPPPPSDAVGNSGNVSNRSTGSNGADGNRSLVPHLREAISPPAVQQLLQLKTSASVEPPPNASSVAAVRVRVPVRVRVRIRQYLAGLAAAREQVHERRLSRAHRPMQVCTAHAIRLATATTSSGRRLRNAYVDSLQQLDHLSLRAVREPLAATHEPAEKRQRAAMLAPTAQRPPAQLHRSGPAHA